MFTRNYTVGAADVAAKRIVKFDGSLTIVVGAAATDSLIGVSASGVIAVIGGPIDVVHHGPARVKAGGTITAGDLVTSDGTGKAVAAAPASNVDNRHVGMALESAVDGDEFEIFVNPGSVSNAA